ncbi:MAG: hypothetical protein ABIH89_02675 [Elusimicrobiota bacterium]
MKKTAYLFFISIITFTGNIYGSSTFSGWTIFNKSQSAQFRTVAAVSPESGGISGFVYNPAVLGQGAQREISFISELGPAADKYGGILYSEPLRKLTFAGGIIYYDAGKVELNWLENGSLMTKDVSA